MNLEIESMYKINRKATHILFQEMGAVDALRFLNQFTTGSGDYTKERGQWLDNLKFEDIVSGIKDRRSK